MKPKKLQIKKQIVFVSKRETFIHKGNYGDSTMACDTVTTGTGSITFTTILTSVI